MSLTKTEFESLKSRYGEKAWAHALKLRHERGDTINRNQVRCYRNTLGLNMPVQ
jgi:hypothetical protein